MASIGAKGDHGHTLRAPIVLGPEGVEAVTALERSRHLDRRQQWAVLLADIQAAHQGDPAGAEAQALAQRFVALMDSWVGGAIGARSLEAFALQSPGGPARSDSASEKVWSFLGRSLSAMREG